ncbi:Histone-lysine N-methyltransferase 2E [Oopsacas minuta]|uniref:Histone-lysine N-methyltransferase 2E n=1 Tax=Oopsacas minuta TaxID=111878 RepID=A0AAV7KIS7_9METZ|nr:Histone-lysine N-methyltransferase 2E [Oopsacas minuta]
MSESTEQDNDVEEGITRCICGFTHDDGYMIWCDGCSVWQHLACMELDQSKLPDKYYCETCDPRQVNADRAKRIQKRFSESDVSGEDTNISSHHSRLVRNIPGLATTNKVDSSTPTTSTHSLIFPTKHSKKHKRTNEKYQSSSHFPRSPTPHFSSPSIRHKYVKPIFPIRGSHDTTESDPQDSEISILSEEVNSFFHSRAKLYSNSEPRETQILSDSVKIYLNRAIGSVDRDSKTVYTSGEGRVIPSPIRPVGINLILVERKRKGIITSASVLSHQLIVELKGNVLDGDTLSQNEGITPSTLNRETVTPFIFVYRGLNKHSVVYIDSRLHGNKARYVRRSCEPNSILRHYILDSHLKFGIFAERDITKEQEVTIPHDSHIQSCLFLVECGCSFRASACPAKSHNLKFKKKRALIGGMEEKTFPDTTIKSETVCPHSEEDLESPMPFFPSKKRKRHRIESDTAPNLPHSTATTPVDFGVVGSLATKKSREDRKLEGVLKLIEKMEARKSSSQEDSALYSPGIGSVSKQRRSSEKVIGNEYALEECSSYRDRPLENKKPDPKKLNLTFSSPSELPEPPSVFENTPLKKLLIQQWGEEVRVMERQKKREVLLADLSPDCNFPLTFPPHPFSDEGEYSFSRWGYTLSPDTSLYKFRGAPKRHALVADTELEKGEDNLEESCCLEPVSSERDEESESERIKKLPIKKQLAYIFNKKERAREREALLLLEVERIQALSEEIAKESQMDMTSDISQDSEDTKQDLSDIEPDNSKESPPRVHSTTSDQMLSLPEPEYMSPLPVQYSPSPQSSPNPVSPLSIASSSQDSASVPSSPKIPHTPSPDPPPPEEVDASSDQITDPIIHPPTELSRADSSFSQVSSTLDSPQFLSVLKPLVSDYISPSLSPTVIQTEEAPVSSNKESLYSNLPIVTQDISPAEEPSHITLINSPVQYINDHSSNPKVSLERAKASSLDSVIGSDYKFSKSRLTPDPTHRRSLTSHTSPRFIDPKQQLHYTPIESQPNKRRYVNRDTLDPILSRMDLSVQFGSPSKETDTPITPVESVTPLSDAGSNLSASGKKVLSMKEYFKRKEQSRASSSSSQTHLHLSPGHTPPPPRRERSRSNSSVNISEPSFWTECRRGKEKRPDWDREKDRYHYTRDNKSHTRHYSKESAYRSKDRSREKHKSKHRDRYRDRYDDLSSHYSSRDHRRRASSGVFDDSRSRHSSFKSTEIPRLPCPSLAEIEPVSPDNSGEEGNIPSPTNYPSDRRFSTTTSIPLPNETIPPDDSRLLTLKFFLRQTNEQGNT